MVEIYTISSGDMWREALNGIATIIGTSTFHTLMRITGTLSVLGVVAGYIKGRNPMEFVKWIALFVLFTSVLLVPKRSVQIIDITDQAAVYEVDNVPAGLAGIAHLTTGVGYSVAQMYDYIMARPDSVTYTKTGMLFGSQIVSQTTDFQTQNPELAQMLPDYVENCVIGDILLNHKYTVNDLLNSTDPLGLITNNPSPLRGIYKTANNNRVFETCLQAATEIKALVNADTQFTGQTFQWLSGRIFGNKINAASLLSQAMGDSYGYFYSGGLSASQIMKNNITNSAIRMGISGFAARSSDTANLVNLASESSMTKQRLSWAAGGNIATRTLPFMQSLLMLILVCLFPLVIALASANHSIFGLNTLKTYICGFIYFQMWPVMFAILNFAATFYLQSKTGNTPLVLANQDQVALQHSDVANMASYMSLSIPVLSFFLTRGAASIGSQVAGSIFGSMAFGSAGQASTTADGNWSFNNMSMDNLHQNKVDTNFVQRSGQVSRQLDGGSMMTQTADGHTVYDTSGAISNLPVNMRLSQLASSGFTEQARRSEVQAQTALDGYNHSVTSSWSQLQQMSHQTGRSDSLTQGSDNSQAVNANQGASMMMSAVQSYAKANNISEQQAYNQLMQKSQDGTFNTGASAKFDSGDQAFGKIGKWAVGVSGEAHAGGEYKASSGSSHGTQDNNSKTNDYRHDENSQFAKDFKQGLDMVTSSRVSDSGNHTDNTSNSDVQQFSASLNDAKNKYHQYSDSTTRSQEYSRMATLAQNQSASLDTNYNQEFADWTTQKYGDKSQQILTSAPAAQAAAAEFVEERLKPQIMGDYNQGRSELKTGTSHDVYSDNQLAGGTPHNMNDSVVDNTQVNGAISSSKENYAPSSDNFDKKIISGHGENNSNNLMAKNPVHQPTEGNSYDINAIHSRSSANGISGHSVANVNGDTKRINEKDSIGEGMMSDFNHNRGMLHDMSAAEFSGGEGIKQKVAEQRSANQQNIDKSAEHIGGKRETVQKTSDIMKGEVTSATSRFSKGYSDERHEQGSADGSTNREDIERQLQELRKRHAG